MTNDDNGNIGNTESNETKKRLKIAAPLKYLSIFWSSLEMPWIIAELTFH